MQKFGIAFLISVLVYLGPVCLNPVSAEEGGVDSVKVTGTQTHLVQEGETLYGISRKYQVTVDGLLYANRFLSEDFVIHPGDNLLIPDEASVQRLAAIKPNCQVVKCKYHVVQPGETLFAISRKYDDLTVQKLLELNELDSDLLKPGQEIIVAILDEKIAEVHEVKERNDHWARARERMEQEEQVAEQQRDQSLPGQPVIVASTQKFNSVNDVIQHYKAIFDSYKEEDLTKKKNRCVANYLEEETDNTSYFALYNDAEVGSVLKVRNLMNNNIVYLRVVGSVPDLDQDNSIALKVSNSAAKKLNVLDDKFQAEVVSFVR